MERLTDHENEHYNQPGCNSCSDYRWRSCKESGEIDDCIQRLTWLRLLDIEDILGDDYDLDRLRCAVESLAEAEAANTQLDGAATTLMESNRKLAEALEAEKARADEAEAALAAAVRDMEAMALTIRQRKDHDTECCPFCKYDCPEEDYCPGWEGEECFQWRGK